MHQHWLLLMGCCLVAAASGAEQVAGDTPPASSRRVSAPAYTARGWHRTNVSLSPDQIVTFSLALVERNRGELLRIATAVSDPRSTHYGQYLTQPELSALTAPLATHTTAVKKWLDRSGVAWTLVGVSTVAVRATVQHASELLHTRFHMLQHAVSGSTVIRAGDYELPTGVHGAISAVFGLHQLPPPPCMRLRSSPTFADHPSGAAITPAVFRSTYGVHAVKVSRSEKNRHAVIADYGEYINSTDIETMFADYVSNYHKGVDDRLYRYVGERRPYDPHAGGAEGQLDIQWIMAPSPGILSEFWAYYDASLGFNEFIYKWTANITAQQDVPLVWSVSYGVQYNASQGGAQEAEQVAAVEHNLAKLAAKGITIVVSSGDNGAGYTKPEPNECCEVEPKLVGVLLRGSVQKVLSRYIESAEDCCATAFSENVSWTFEKTLFGAQCTLFSHVDSEVPTTTRSTVSGYAPPPSRYPVKLWPSWPASSPWVTAIGATQFRDDIIGNEEIAVTDFGSGGGFEGSQEHASWQLEATQNYFATVSPMTLPPPETYTRAGRGTPDAAALGKDYQIIVYGRRGSIGGTSASAPAFASMVSLLNEERLNAGKPQMGFLNPFLYQNAGTAFSDVVTGDNRMDKRGERTLLGWNCTRGWDPVTGLGTPVFPQLLAAAMA